MMLDPNPAFVQLDMLNRVITEWCLTNNVRHGTGQYRAAVAMARSLSKPGLNTAGELLAELSRAMTVWEPNAIV